MKKFFLFAMILFFSYQMLAQTVDYSFRFNGIGDNREFFSNYNKPQTILGTRASFSLGGKIDSVHQVRVGIDYFYEYGSRLGELPPNLILYYQFLNHRWHFRMGTFARKDVMDLPLAIVADDWDYFNPNLEGLFVGYRNNSVNMNAYVDWISRQSNTRREQFMAGINGDAHFKKITLSFNGYMFHNAKTAVWNENTYIEDYMGGLILVGYDFSGILPLDIAYVKTGILSSLARNRGEGMDFRLANSSYTQLQLEKSGIGLRGTFNMGGKHSFYFGDSFYSNTTSYHRIDLYVTPLNFKNVKGRLGWSFHIANGDLDNQQQFSLLYTFGNDLCRKQ